MGINGANVRFTWQNRISNKINKIYFRNDALKTLNGVPSPQNMA